MRNPVSSSFAAIRDKVRGAEPLSLEDGVALFRHPNPLEVGALANEVRERLHGDRTYFNRNLHINATNVCEASCMFCSSEISVEGSSTISTTRRSTTISNSPVSSWIEISA